MRKSAIVFVAVALFGFASKLNTANAQSLTSPTSAFQAFATDARDGAAAIIASVEAAVGNLAAAITSHTIVASNTASAADSAVASIGAENAAEEPTAPKVSAPTSPSGPAAPATAPTSTEAPVEPIIQYDAAAAPVPFDILELQNSVSALTQGVQGLTALLETQTPSSQIESQIAALQSTLSLQVSRQSYNASAYVPLGDGAPNTIAAVSNIGNLSGVTITNANLTASEIPALDYLSLSGGSLSGNLNVPTLTASSTIFAGFTTINATTTNLSVTGTGNFASNVGIGTTSPSRLLTLDSSSATGTILRMSNTSTGGHVYDFLETGSANTGGAGRLDFYDSTAGLARLSIAANGNIGVGTTSPFTNFAVNGSGYFSGNLNLGGALSALTLSGNGAGIFSTPIIASGAYHAFGDSITAGYGASVSANAYANLLATDSGATITNRAIAGEQACDMGDLQIFPYENTTATQNPLYTILIGTNDAYIRAFSPFFESGGIPIVWGDSHMSAG